MCRIGADILVALNASPFDSAKPERRMSTAVARTVETGLPLIYVNMVGGQDELVYDGASFALNADGSLASHLPSFLKPLFWFSFRLLPGISV